MDRYFVVHNFEGAEMLASTYKRAHIVMRYVTYVVMRVCHSSSGAMARVK